MTDAELTEQQLSRTIALLGNEAVTLLSRARVAIVGTSAAAAHAALHLARSGVGRIELVASQRHLVNVNDLQLNPTVRRVDVVEKTKSFVDCVASSADALWPRSSQRVSVVGVENLNELFLKQSDDSLRVVAIIHDDADGDDDDGSVLADEIQQCYKHNVPVVAVVARSWRGASDVTRLRICAASDSAVDDFAARRVRRHLLRRDVRHNVALIHANQPVEHLGVAGFGAVVATTLGSVVASQMMACVTQHMPLEWCAATAPGHAVFVREAHSTFCARSRTKTTGFALTLRQVEYVIDCMWNQRSAWSRRAGKLWLALVDPTAPANECNVIPLLDDELKLFTAEGGGLALFSEEQRAFVKEVFEFERHLNDD
jgi:tRNA A37 threonylcarbamoyladenosine dehydratase